MIQQTARAISLEMALRDMIAAGHKVQLSAETSAWFDLVIRNHYQRDGFLLLTLYKDSIHIGTGTAPVKGDLFKPRTTHSSFKRRVNRALEVALGGTPC